VGCLTEPGSGLRAAPGLRPSVLGGPPPVGDPRPRSSLGTVPTAGFSAPQFLQQYQDLSLQASWGPFQPRAPDLDATQASEQALTLGRDRPGMGLWWPPSPFFWANKGLPTICCCSDLFGLGRMGAPGTAGPAPPTWPNRTAPQPVQSPTSSPQPQKPSPQLG
jgi:hypothetical protein